jgi:hypothetical protein
LGFGKSEIFLARGLDRFLRAGVICPSGSHIAVTQRTDSSHRHCEEQRDEAIHSFFPRMDGLLRCARNDVEIVGPITLEGWSMTVFD